MDIENQLAIGTGSLTIKDSTAMASIQDLGRFKYRSMGIGTNGAMDPWALQAGNALLKNELDTPTIELALGSMNIQFNASTCFCLTGGIYEAYLDEKRVYSYWRIHAKVGQTLKLVRPLQGMYAYLCVQGGFHIKPVLGSISTNTKAAFGGFDGRFLKSGDELPFAQQNSADTNALDSSVLDSNKNSHEHEPLPIIGIASIKPVVESDSINQIRVLKNSEYDAFTDAAKKAFENQLYTVNTSSNRMGYRCVGNTELVFKQTVETSSHGVAAGMIQVPPQGQPIVLMADSQTTGGYPKIATVIEADIGLMAQTRFGKICTFKIVDLQEAIEARSERQNYIKRIQRYANDN